MKNRLFTRFSGVMVACGVACAVMAGCASTQQNVPPTADQFNKQLADADAVAKAGDQDKAIGLYQDLAKADPTREEPWSRIAQIQFSQNHYGQAIVAAQEALQRDQTDRTAKSVLAVSGLRIATESLGELRDDAALQGDAKSDAQALAVQLRDTLGESELFPPDQQPKQPVKRRRVVRHAKAPAVASGADATAAAAPANPAPAGAAPTAAAQAPAPAKAGDPFSALR
ncbi:tetratricopeptide repeat protein [Paraburkholderia sp. B3]|uniref:tetratricopeptide repeat protein n=1 Tax=Paraburkholderia sp. B3 TaxID=3134791 RepID=UPI00398249DC